MGTFGLLVVVGLAGCVRSGFPLDDAEAPRDATVAADASLLGLVSARESRVLGGQYDVTFDGQRYAVAWVEYPAGSFQRQIMFALVSAQGQIIAGPQTLGTIEQSMSYRELIAQDDRFLLFYQRSDNSGLDVMRIEPQADRFTVDHDYLAASLSEARVAAAKDGFVVVYRKYVTCLVDQTSSRYQIYLRWLDADATILSAEGEPLECTGETQVGPELAWTGSQHFVAWLDYRAGAVNRYGLVDADLTLVGGQSHPVATTPSTQDRPHLAHDGLDHALVGWRDADRLMLRAIDLAAGPLWDGVATPEPANRAESLTWTMAGGNGRIGLAWETDVEHSLTQIRWASLSSSALAEKPTALTSELLSDPDHGYCCPKLARGDGSFAVIFTGTVAGTYGLFLKVLPDP